MRRKVDEIEAAAAGRGQGRVAAGGIEVDFGSDVFGGIEEGSDDDVVLDGEEVSALSEFGFPEDGMAGEEELKSNRDR